jgi:hypothetical protein
MMEAPTLESVETKLITKAAYKKYLRMETAMKQAGRIDGCRIGMHYEDRRRIDLWWLNRFLVTSKYKKVKVVPYQGDLCRCKIFELK